MARSASLEAALKRLTSALDLLEAAGSRLAETGAGKADLEQALAVMQDDRARLAQDLDKALAQRQTLEEAQAQVVRRLSEAGGLLRDLLADDQPEQD